MTVVSGDLKIVTNTPSRVTEVWVRAKGLRTHGSGVVLEEQDRKPVEGGHVSFEALAGPAVMVLVHAGAPERPIPLSIPDQPEVTLADCVRLAGLADDATRSELERLALEVADKVATITNITMLEEWASTAKTEADRAVAETATIPQEVQAALSTSLAPTIQSELDTRVPPQVASAIAADRAVADAAAAAADTAVTGLLGAAEAKLGQVPKWSGAGFRWSWADQHVDLYDNTY